MKGCEKIDLVKVFNENRSKDIFLRELLHKEDSTRLTFEETSRERLEDFLDHDVKSLNITVTGKKSGNDLTKTYVWCLICGITFSDKREMVGEYRETFTKEDGLHYLIPKILAPTMFDEELENGYIRRIPVDAFHLRFSFEYVLKGETSSHHITLDIDQELEEETDSAGRYRVSDNLPCKVVVR